MGSQKNVLFLMIGEGDGLEGVDLPENFLLLGGRLREDVVKLMHLSDVFVLASTQEDPFGMVVAEAMMAGTPVIVTSACGVSQYLTNQKDAIVIRPKSGSEIAENILRLYRNPGLRERLGSQGKETAEKEFTLERMIAELDKVFQGKV
ncbi:MAG: glycosyl transferase group 1 [uncultured bacterium]|nr:MAG: glycosyl transferase group 1 [uncultured bacterium]